MSLFKKKMFKKKVTLKKKEKRYGAILTKYSTRGAQKQRQVNNVRNHNDQGGRCGVIGSDDGGWVRWCKQFLLLPREQNTLHSVALNYIVRTIYGGGQEAWRGKLCMHLDQLQSYICWSTISDSVRWLPAFPISQNSFFVLLMISIVVVVVIIIIMYTHLNNTDMTLV